MNMQNKFKIILKENVHSECQTISDAHKLKQEEFKTLKCTPLQIQADIQGLEFLLSNSRTFKDFQVCTNPVRLTSVQK